MNDQEWKAWGEKLQWLIDRTEVRDHLEELAGLAQGCIESNTDELERNTGSGWTWNMGPWGEELQAIETHLEAFDPRDFDAYLKRLSEGGAR